MSEFGKPVFVDSDKRVHLDDYLELQTRCNELAKMNSDGCDLLAKEITKVQKLRECIEAARALLQETTQ